MFRFKSILLSIITTLISITSYANLQPSPIENFDLQRYQGLWNQLSAIPTSFQENCVANTTAKYATLDNGYVQVINSCNEKDNSKSTSEARARMNDTFGLDSTLEVTFVKIPILGWLWSTAGDYWIIYINESYDLAIVGHPTYKYGWILSRNETISFKKYTELNNELINQGYDSCEFLMSQTPSQSFNKETRLCDYINGVN